MGRGQGQPQAGSAAIARPRADGHLSTWEISDEDAPQRREIRGPDGTLYLVSDGEHGIGWVLTSPGGSDRILSLSEVLELLPWEMHGNTHAMTVAFIAELRDQTLKGLDDASYFLDNKYSEEPDTQAASDELAGAALLAAAASRLWREIAGERLDIPEQSDTAAPLPAPPPASYFELYDGEYVAAEDGVEVERLRFVEYPPAGWWLQRPGEEPRSLSFAEAVDRLPAPLVVDASRRQDDAARHLLYDVLMPETAAIHERIKNSASIDTSHADELSKLAAVGEIVTASPDLS